MLFLATQNSSREAAYFIRPQELLKTALCRHVRDQMCLNLLHGWYAPVVHRSKILPYKEYVELCQNQPRDLLMRLVTLSTNAFTGKQGTTLQLSYPANTGSSLVCSNEACLLLPEQGTWVLVCLQCLSVHSTTQINNATLQMFSTRQHSISRLTFYWCSNQE